METIAARVGRKSGVASVSGSIVRKNGQKPHCSVNEGHAQEADFIAWDQFPKLALPSEALEMLV